VYTIGTRKGSAIVIHEFFVVCLSQVKIHIATVNEKKPGNGKRR